jgi:hypothetical protein
LASTHAFEGGRGALAALVLALDEAAELAADVDALGAVIGRGPGPLAAGLHARSSTGSAVKPSEPNTTSAATGAERDGSDIGQREHSPGAGHRYRIRAPLR